MSSPNEAFQWQEHVRVQRLKPCCHVRRHKMQEDAGMRASESDSRAQVHWASVQGENNVAALGKGLQHVL